MKRHTANQSFQLPTTRTKPVLPSRPLSTFCFAGALGRNLRITVESNGKMSYNNGTQRQHMCWYTENRGQAKLRLTMVAPQQRLEHTSSPDSSPELLSWSDVALGIFCCHNPTAYHWWLWQFKTSQTYVSVPSIYICIMYIYIYRLIQISIYDILLYTHNTIPTRGKE